MKVIDLCSGTGAFTLVAQGLGMEVVYSNDIDESSQIMHQSNFNNTPFVKGDITSIDPFSIPDHDLLIGGFPCQSFSLAGMRKGFEDKRSNVFWSICDILDAKKPSYFLLENVKNLVSHDKGQTFDIIKQALTDLGYKIKYAILDTRKITNIPHHRERIYIFGSLNNYPLIDMDFPTIKNNKIESMLEEGRIDPKYYYTDRFKVYNTVSKGVVKKGIVYQYRRTSMRENKTGVCPTLTANMGGGGHNVPLILDDKGVRKLTPRECFNLQGFPESYTLPTQLSDSKLYKLAGNAVSVPVITLILKRIMF